MCTFLLHFSSESCRDIDRLHWCTAISGWRYILFLVLPGHNLSRRQNSICQAIPCKLFFQLWQWVGHVRNEYALSDVQVFALHLFLVAVAWYRLLVDIEIALVLRIANWGWHHVSHHSSQLSSWLFLAWAELSTFAWHSQASPLLFEFMQMDFGSEKKSLKGLCLQWFVSKCPCEDASKLCKSLLKIQQTIFYDWCDAIRSGGLTADQVRLVLPAALQVAEFSDSKRWFLGDRHVLKYASFSDVIAEGV